MTKERPGKVRYTHKQSPERYHVKPRQTIQLLPPIHIGNRHVCRLPDQTVRYDYRELSHKDVQIPHNYPVMRARLTAVRSTLAAISAALASLLAHETTAERCQTVYTLALHSWNHPTPISIPDSLHTPTSGIAPKTWYCMTSQAR
jgi:hypothetical protein